MKLIALNQLRSGMITARNVYSSWNRVQPYLRTNTVLTQAIIREMRRLGIRSVYVKDEAEGAAPPPTDGSGEGPSPTISDRLCNQAVSALQNAFSLAAVATRDIHRSTQVLRQLDAVVDELIESIRKEVGVLVNISNLKSYDDYTYHHSLSVAVIALAIAESMGFNKARLHQLGMSAILHDIGKTVVPLDLINKPAKLEAHEYEIVKQHSAAGYDYLLRTATGDDTIRDGVLYHHERLDGTGYPFGLQGKNIPIFSRILSVADVYDALTSHRPYRTPLEPCEAIEYIMGSADTQFDHDVILAFLKRVELYPVGSCILLSDGRAAEVLDNRLSQLRPVVRIVETGQVIDLFSDKKALNIVVPTKHTV